MAQDTIIAWTHHTFNPWWGCTKVSDGCKNCYAERQSSRWGFSLWGPRATRRITSEDNWRKPRQWNREAELAGERRRVFCGSMMDWAEKRPELVAPRLRLWDTIRATPWLDWQLLTKRPENIAEFLPDDWGAGYPNVWLGTSIEDMRVEQRAHVLRELPAVVRFISYEPALGPLHELDLTDIDWVIYGGESGPDFRDHDPEWARLMRRACDRRGVAFFFKQSAAPRTEMGTTLDGETVRKYPTPRRVAIFDAIGGDKQTHAPTRACRHHAEHSDAREARD